jgi:hypothetical protein
MVGDIDDRAILSAVKAVLPETRVGKRGQRGETWLLRDRVGEIKARKFKGRSGGRPLR